MTRNKRQSTYQFQRSNSAVERQTYFLNVPAGPVDTNVVTAFGINGMSSFGEALLILVAMFLDIGGMW
jgi:hypothetical protein